MAMLNLNKIEIIIAALNTINDFERRTDKGTFPHIDRKKVANQLRERVRDPSLIDQLGSSLCGPAVFLYINALKNPKRYADYIIDLYEKGEASLGDLKIKPGRDCKNYKIDPGKIAAADWIGLAGLKDSVNAAFDYQSPDNQFSGITLPHNLQHWFRASGFRLVLNKTNLVFDKGPYTLLQANQKHQSGSFVCLFVGVKVLLGSRKGKVPADHWVVLNSPIRIDNQPVAKYYALGKEVNEDKSLFTKKLDFSAYTWGEAKYSVRKRNHHLTVGDFLDYFYGYISAK